MALLHCAGWKRLQIAGATVEYMAATDPEGLEGLIAHNEFGARSNCWNY
ncbi:MAG: hypothetical protein QM523_01120 [Candidatus Pacebacteria bacterium]|nr:hypothetical protein [Candidatus Paceibacterota bacterium]